MQETLTDQLENKVLIEAVSGKLDNIHCSFSLYSKDKKLDYEEFVHNQTFIGKIKYFNLLVDEKTILKVKIVDKNLGLPISNEFTFLCSDKFCFNELIYNNRDQFAFYGKFGLNKKLSDFDEDLFLFGKYSATLFDTK